MQDDFVFQGITREKQARTLFFFQCACFKTERFHQGESIYCPSEIRVGIVYLTLLDY